MPPPTPPTPPTHPASQSAGPLHVDMGGAPDAIRQLAGRARLEAPVIVGITGPVGAGKSYLASHLSSCVISTDHYLPDYDITPEHLRDLPEKSDLARLARDLAELGMGRATAIPVWSFHTHSRVGEQTIEPRELVVVEGLHALHETHAHALHIRVYVDAPRDTRWARWEHLEEIGERGWGVEVAKRFFENVAEPTFHARSAAYRGGAHVVVVNDQYRPKAV